MPHRVKEFHFITSISNISSVLKHGILSRNRVRKLKIKHTDISMSEIQDRRKTKVIPNGRTLHDYANLYFDARNPMLYKRKNEANEICVLAVSLKVLELPGVVITDQNAGSDYVLFMSPDQLNGLNFDRIYAKYWTHPDDPRKEYRHRSEKCAEVLVPNLVDHQYIQQAYVVDKNASDNLSAHGFDRPIIINSNLFFR